MSWQVRDGARMGPEGVSTGTMHPRTPPSATPNDALAVVLFRGFRGDDKRTGTVSCGFADTKFHKMTCEMWLFCYIRLSCPAGSGDRNAANCNEFLAGTLHTQVVYEVGIYRPTSLRDSVARIRERQQQNSACHKVARPSIISISATAGISDASQTWLSRRYSASHSLPLGGFPLPSFEGVPVLSVSGKDARCKMPSYAAQGIWLPKKPVPFSPGEHGERGTWPSKVTDQRCHNTSNESPHQISRPYWRALSSKSLSRNGVNELATSACQYK
ncbi:uncharacterized protein BCR38DRAFT_472284 [Pseudomassariella vexata]|uniref:Uncharacterized protein n=1 Tax=Pseudomassariella vexata TaxID=1141098 RepID=A0A1Y2EB89_9PEZI|nr:uncharacterized protein BCR38DRAFT_472284 [Pseudomassariella vexata]ORY68821.1 hypothetical protein BCR38DRAFT_472284 [Pseudomassariella vexata]